MMLLSPVLSSATNQQYQPEWQQNIINFKNVTGVSILNVYSAFMIGTEK
jgi:hypothetical protein